MTFALPRLVIYPPLLHNINDISDLHLNSVQCFLQHYHKSMSRHQLSKASATAASNTEDSSPSCYLLVCQNYR